MHVSSLGVIAFVLAQIFSPPSLGSPVINFEQVLGGPNDASVGPIMHFARCAGTNVDQFVLFAPGDQVWSIQREWCELATRGADERFADAAQYLPADAVPGSPFSTDLGESALTDTRSETRPRRAERRRASTAPAREPPPPGSDRNRRGAPPT